LGLSLERVQGVAGDAAARFDFFTSLSVETPFSLNSFHELLGTGVMLADSVARTLCLLLALI